MIHDILKIFYSEEGYLSAYPYHLLSDEEMFNAFMNDEREGFFYDEYPLIDESLAEKYEKLEMSIRYHVRSKIADPSYELPDWVYSYMIGAVVGPYSTQKDKHDLFVMLNADNIDDIFTLEVANACYEVSSSWVCKIPGYDTAVTVELDGEEYITTLRPPSVFGEMHVIKSLRLAQAV